MRKENTPTFAIETHGCKLNQADSLVLAREFVMAGYKQVSVGQPSDVYLLNSCTVTHTADKKARQALRRARRLNPNATLVAAGCYTERAQDDVKSMEEVDLVFGNRDKTSLVNTVQNWIRGSSTTWSNALVGPMDLALRTDVSRARAMVKIQEGCNQVCAYCIVPKVRGREVSINPDQIIKEINSRSMEGYQEVVLTGTQLGTYGFEWQNMDLCELLRRILNATDIGRIRVSSLQPQEISSELLQLWRNERLCPHFHLPLQSGSNNILTKMRRRYRSEDYVDSAVMIRNTVANASITADVITGFPGETEEDFSLTCEIVEELGFSDLHVFPYSPRPGTSAAYFDGQVDGQTKARRQRVLLDLGDMHRMTFRTRMVGSVHSVLWESMTSFNKQSYWSGLTGNYIRVLRKTNLPITECISDVMLVGTIGKDVMGELT